ncbi:MULTISPECIES: hypothetical protein [unclassified Bradyrhizobium]|uniref:hypothetical protein n=1 Tax=unclassified Bradyrhizobium TaxID=2631580 RepID=UPI0024793C48|nr:MULTISPECIES: hypothetical protein [unclassified Bradyrhizobium]WGS19653.1 hypothetical protein MTX22_35720 [Bradyrhizobium sp. ISRA463]WGS26495.1 hypothetical protein MTX19_33175 [Bradyrhizobium sp. ISRA464]
MTKEQQTTQSGPEKLTMAGELSALIRESWRALVGWACLIGASLIGFGLTEGTSYHHLATGILLTSSTLFILMALFEGVWRLFVDHES